MLSGNFMRWRSASSELRLVMAVSTAEELLRYHKFRMGEFTRVTSVADKLSRLVVRRCGMSIMGES